MPSSTAEALDKLTSIVATISSQDPRNASDTLRNHTLRLVDAELETQQQSLSSLLDKVNQLSFVRNSLAPINKLPVELLSAVFGYLLESDEDCNTDLISATHICTHWRSSALANPVFWATFTLCDLDAVKEFMARSKAMPLSVTLKTNPACLRDMVQLLVHEMPRVRSLKIKLEDIAVIARVLSRFNRPAPRLEELWIEKIRWQSTGSRDMWTAEIGRDIRQMCRGEMPNLRMLVNRGMQTLPIYTKSENLVRLELDRALPPPREIMDLLRRCKDLEVLCLRGKIMDQNDVMIAPGTQEVTLPKLKSLKMGIFPSAAGLDILRKLVVPNEKANVDIEVCMAPDRFFEALVHPDDPAMCMNRRLRCLQGYRRLELVYGGFTFELRAFRHADDFNLTPALRLVAFRPLGDFDELFQGMRFFAKWPFVTSDVETLVVTWGTGPGGPGERDRWPICREHRAWAKPFRQLPKLKTLRIVSLHTEDAVEAMVELMTYKAGEHATGMDCEHLRTLELVDLGHRTGLKDRLRPQSELTSPVARLIFCRAMMKCHLKEVELVNAGPLSWSEDEREQMRQEETKVYMNEEQIN